MDYAVVILDKRNNSVIDSVWGCKESAYWRSGFMNDSFHLTGEYLYKFSGVYAIEDCDPLNAHGRVVVEKPPWAFL